MADRYWVGGTDNWNGTAGLKWSTTSGGAGGAAVPTSSDDVFFDANSGAVTVTVTATANSLTLTFTGFTGTFAGSSGLTTRTSLILDAGMTLTYTGTLSFINLTNALSLTSNGITWTGAITFTSTITTTLVDDWTVTGTVTSAGTINGNNIYLQGSLSTALTTIGTTIFNFTGTGSWTSTGNGIFAPIIINTAGTLTISGTVRAGGQTITYTTGTVVTTGSTLNLAGGTTTFNTSGMSFNNIAMVSIGGITLTSDLNITGTLTSTAAITTSGAFNINTASLTATAAISGTASIIFNGTGTWSGAGIVSIPMEINTAGTLTITGTVSYMNGTFTYRRGKVIAGTATLNIALSCTLINIHKIVFGSVIVLGGQVVTMNEFFSGSANIRTRISSTNTTNYIITFQDGFEKISKFVRISNATITNRGQLLVITDKANANTAGAVNLGVRYSNVSPNGIAKNNSNVKTLACFGIEDGFLSEPLSK